MVRKDANGEYVLDPRVTADEAREAELRNRIREREMQHQLMAAQEARDMALQQQGALGLGNILGGAFGQHHQQQALRQLMDNHLLASVPPPMQISKKQIVIAKEDDERRGSLRHKLRYELDQYLKDWNE
jgi:hypothetical protein